MAKKTNFGPDLGPFGPNLTPKNFFSRFLPLVDVIHCCKISLNPISKKINEPNLKNSKKPSFGHDFVPFGQI